MGSHTLFPKTTFTTTAVMIHHIIQNNSGAKYQIDKPINLDSTRGGGEPTKSLSTTTGLSRNMN